MRRRIKETINNTGRRIIRERDVSLTVIADPPTVRLLEIKLPDLAAEIPDWSAATVFVEASQARTASFDRYSVGTVAEVGAKKPVDLRQLRNFADASDAVFAIKIVSGDGKILASADDVRPDERRPADREALLQVQGASDGRIALDCRI